MASPDRTRPQYRTPDAGAEPSAEEKRAAADYAQIAASEEFKQLLRAKRRFIIPATIFFLLYYFALPYLVGYHPDLMQRRVWREINWAYLFAFSQFIMAWILAGVYVWVAAGWDRKAKALLALQNIEA
ncbi:MAG TPA: DUF485 domain-containing protein [Chthoniobacterales bacterium]|nr:DUF485 domain-containing protein [Chthoniobacterales bacterium]